MGEAPTLKSASATLVEMLSEFGEVETTPLTRNGRMGAQRLARSWPLTPQVTHHDEADITDLEARRKAQNAAGGLRLTALPYIIKASVSALQTFPNFNAAFDGEGAQLIQRKYYNVGVAIDTPNGLVVGVVRQCDQKSKADIAQEVNALSEKARGKGLSFNEVTGGGFTISALGGLGGTSFTPIVNPPEVAILGVSRAKEQPVRGPNGEMRWRLMLPLSLSYDHRAINGADAARFASHLCAELEKAE